MSDIPRDKPVNQDLPSRSMTRDATAGGAVAGGDAADFIDVAVADVPQEPFWRTATLEEMTDQQWESLCDGCGRCCLIKLEDEDTGRIHYTDVGCRLLDGDTCRCSDYPNRQSHVPDCVRLTPETVRALTWLPPTCAYRLVREGVDLPWWHPLVSGDPETVVAAGISVQGRLGGSEQDMEPEELIERIVQWPDRVPRKARALFAPADLKTGHVKTGGVSSGRRGQASRRPV